MPLIRELLESIKGYNSFRDINLFLRVVNEPLPTPVGSNFTYTYSKNGSVWNFNYGLNSKRGVIISGIVVPNEDNGAFLGLEKYDKCPNIYADFAYERKNGNSLIHLQPIFIHKAEIVEYIFSNLERIKNGTFNFNYLNPGEYLEREAELVLEHAEKLPLEEEITLLELFDSIAIQLAEINTTNFEQNKPVIEFTGQYNKGKQLIEKVPKDKRTPVLERRLTL